VLAEAKKRSDITAAEETNPLFQLGDLVSEFTTRWPANELAKN